MDAATAAPRCAHHRTRLPRADVAATISQQRRRRLAPQAHSRCATTACDWKPSKSRRIAYIAWPRAYGGRDATLMQWLIFEEEYWRAGAPQRVTQNGVFLLAPTIFAFGTDEQKARLLRPIAAAECLWAQGWSEPEAGSDLASLRSHAQRVPGGFRLYGQKTWTTRGAFCDKIFGPGSARVDEAKRQVAADPDGAAIDLPAGPSELMVIADATATRLSRPTCRRPSTARTRRCCCPTTSTCSNASRAALAQQLELLPRRDVAKSALPLRTCASDRRRSPKSPTVPPGTFLQVSDPRALLQAGGGIDLPGTPRP
jgi:hypothetical protein